MPLQRRLPKRGFNSHKKDETAEVRLSDIQAIAAEAIDLAVLKSAGVVPQPALRAKVILAGEIKRRVALKGLLVSKGARAAIEAAGGSVELPAPAQPAAPKVKRGPSGEKPAPAEAKGK
jgi:large subunit ribosomal protein L15